MAPATSEANKEVSIPMMEQGGQAGGAASGSPPATLRQAYDNMKNARSTDEKADMFSTMYGFICTSCFVIILLNVLSVLPLYILIVGAIRYHQCPVQSYIPLYMVVDGACFVIRMLSFWYQRWQARKKNAQSVAKPAVPTYVLDLFLLAWLICGSVWVFGTHPGFDDPSSPDYCNKLVYGSAFVYIILKWCAVPLLLLMACCILTAAKLASRGQ